MTGKTIGYARTPIIGQDIAPQVKALKEAGCSEVYFDEAASGPPFDRPGLRQILSALESGDTLKIEKLDAISRSVAGFTSFRECLGERKIRIVLLAGDVETTPLLAETAMRLWVYN